MKTWTRERDDYGRTVHYLHDKDFRILGAVVKHPLRKVGDPEAYWYYRWDLPAAADSLDKRAFFPRLSLAKAALETVTKVCDCGCHVPECWPFDCRVYSADMSACCEVTA